MVKIALATSAAPTYYRPLRDSGYTFVDGGIWANNPVMIALTEALTSFNVERQRMRILSIGCGAETYRVTGGKILLGGMWHWRDIITAAMRLQSQNALGQARLLIGPERIVRLDVPEEIPRIALDDWQGAVTHLPAAAESTLSFDGDRVRSMFLTESVEPYAPAVAASQ
jgi:hypothetical protein